MVTADLPVSREEWAETAVHKHSQYACGKCGRSFRDPHAVYEHLDRGCDGLRKGDRHKQMFVIPDGIDGESRRVLQYVNAEIDRWNARERTENMDHLIEAGRERLRRYGRN